jgi:hypothetical protein
MVARSTWDTPPERSSYQGACRIAPNLPIISQPQPIRAATFNAIRSTWDVPPSDAYYQGAGDIAPLLPVSNLATMLAFESPYTQVIPNLWQLTFALPPTSAMIATQPIVSQPQPVSAATFNAIRSTWEVAPPLPQLGTKIAPFITTQVVSQPQPISAATLLATLRTWDPPVWWPLPSLRLLPQSGPPFQPTPLAAVLPPIIASWAPPQPPAQGYASVAGWLPPTAASSQPPAVSYAALYATLRTWEPPVWWPLPSIRLLPQSGPPFQPTPLAAIFAPILGSWAPPQPPAQGYASVASWLPPPTVPGQPPPTSSALLMSLLRMWDAPVWWPLPSLLLLPQSGPLVTLPPPIQLANLRLLMQAWDAPLVLPQAPFYAPQSQPSYVPSTNPALLRALLSGWDSGAPILQRYPVLTASGPAPQPAPVSGYAQLFQLIRSWDPPVWWPLPSLVQHPYGDKGYSTYMVIMSQPGEDILGGRIASNQYEIEYMSAAASLYGFESPMAFLLDFAVPALMKLPLTFGSQVIIRGVTYKVLQSYMLDDGTFSRARLET